MNHQIILEKMLSGDRKALARCISIVENEGSGYEEIMKSLPASNIPVTGITGAPGAGKSTIADSLTALMVADGKKVAILCIDPSSPFHRGALLGDRIRMNRWFDNPNVFIRSLAGKNSLGGLSPMVIEITEILKSAGFDHVIIETIGVGQNEVEIASLADTTVVVLVPEGGDEVQTMKAGLMEVADIFVVNKSDRPGASMFVKDLNQMTAGAFRKSSQEVPVIKTVATETAGIAELYDAILKNKKEDDPLKSSALLYARRAYMLISADRMKEVRIFDLEQRISDIMSNREFNLYSFLQKYKSETIGF